MILQSLAKSIREQSWFSVVIEIGIVVLGVFLGLQVNAWNVARQESLLERAYLERLQTDIRSDIRALRFSSDQAQDRLAITRQVDDWLHDMDAAPDPDTLVINVHYAGVTFFPTISRFTIEELKSTGDLRLLRNQELKRKIAGYYNQIDLQIEQWIAQSDEGNVETYFRELAFVIDPELRIRAGTIDPAFLQQFLKAEGDGAPTSLAEGQKSTTDIGATRADADRILSRMRARPNFEGYLRDGMYWAHLSAQLMKGVVISAEELDAAITNELKALGQ